MKIAPPAQIVAHIENGSRRKGSSRSELILRYAAAYACTLVAVAAAQLYVPTMFALLLAAITIAGLPISLYLRRTRLKIFGWQMPRFVLNSTVVVVAMFGCLYLLLTQASLFATGFSQAALLAHSTQDSFALLMSMFLIFAAVRSLAIITDKEAVLCAVPSFSVLLLLIVVHRGPAVVAYFLLWALMAAISFALDHRQESRQGIGATIPSIEPGADVKLSARGLATVMSCSLVCAIGISYWLSSRNPEDRGLVEGWILGMAGRATQLALNIPDVSINSGPERQIDFTSGPALPTRTELWTVRAFNLKGENIQPQYWRLFTLSQYNGNTWSQAPGSGTSIHLQQLTEEQWPFRRMLQNSQGAGPGAANMPRFGLRAPLPPAANGVPGGTAQRPGIPPGGGQTGNGQSRNVQPGSTQSGSFQTGGNFPIRRRSGYDVLGQHPEGPRILRSFGNDAQWIFQVVEPRVSNVGFVPSLPAVRTVYMRTNNEKLPPDTIRIRQSNSVDPGVLEPGQQLRMLSAVSTGAQYGLNTRGGGPPTRKTQQDNADITLSRGERQSNLQLPASLRAPNSRVRLLAEQVLREAAPEENDYMRARRLSIMLQQRAIYTLRPPAIPANIDATEYFLFQSRRGYCTYFAGALTVLCRSVGIPARVVSGFVNPEWMEGGEAGVLREANAHAWTEIWVEGWGWTTVDATPPDNRGDNAPGWWENWADLIGAVLDNARQWYGSHRSLVIIGALLLLPIALLLAARQGMADPLLARLQTATSGRIQINRDQARRVIFKSYEHAAKKLARRFRRRTHWETPSEWLAAAEATLELEKPQPLRELTRLYQQARYSPHEISGEDGVAAVEEVRRLSWRTKKSS